MPKSKIVPLFNVEKTKKVVKYHSSFSQYKATPLIKLSNLAKTVGVSQIYEKDESKRFDLNAFKALGGSYGIANYIAEKIFDGEKISPVQDNGYSA